MFLDIPRICVCSVLTTFYQLQEFLSSTSSLPFHHLGIFLLFVLIRFSNVLQIPRMRVFGS